MTLTTIDATDIGEQAAAVLLGKPAVARRLGITESTLDWLIHKDDGSAPPSLKVGRLRKFRAEDVDRWIADRVGAAG